MSSLKEIIIAVIAIAILVVAPHLIRLPIPFLYTVPMIVLVWVLLKWEKENFTAIGFSFKRLGMRAVVTGITGGIAIFLFLQYAFFPLLEKFSFKEPAKLEEFEFIRHHGGNYVFMLIMGWIVGGLYEEIVFHGFIFFKIEKLSGGRYALPVSFILTNLIFGLYHFQLGTTGVINALLAGSAYHALMIYFNRNMWYAVIAHGVFDTIALTYIYLGYW